jgi:4-aminobutyrate aminotransferase/(S)-3-amino-2-methylpropionate transaminase
MVELRGDTHASKGSENSDLVKRDKDSVVSGPRRWPDLFFAAGKGAKLIDVDGNSYTDLTAGGAACNVGHNNDSVVKAICDQAQSLIHIGYQSAGHRPELELADTLRNIAPQNLSKGKIAFTNSGSEAVDVALRVSRLCTRRHVFLAYECSHHGVTMAASWVSGDTGLRVGIAPRGLDVICLPYPYCYRCPLGLRYEDCGLACVEYVRRALARNVLVDDVSCLLFEPVQQAAGIVVPPKEYFGEIAKHCREMGIMMIADEVVTALGRTGRMFGMDNFGISANMVVLGKPLASGMPLGAVIGERELMDQAAKSIHALESGAANPICCAASLESIRLIRRDNLEKRAAAMGEEVLGRLRDFADDVGEIGEVRGLGLMIGVELVKNRQSKQPASELAKKVMREATKRGVLIDALGPSRNVLRISPPLNIPAEDMTRSIDTIEEILASLSARHQSSLSS